MSAGNAEHRSRVDGLRAITNPPAQDMIAYRSGDWSSFLNGLLNRLQDGDREALAALTTGESDDYTRALMDAWATVADVLTFYNERIANESYLRTAREQRSLRHLARLVGYEPVQGVAASTYLAFTLDDTPGSPPRVDIPKGTQAQSIPQENIPQADDLQAGVQGSGGEMPQPQPYETLADFIARPEWNALRPRPTQRRVIGADTRRAWFASQGAAGTLRTGDMLLFLKDGQWAAARVTTVKPDPASGRIKLAWSNPLPPGHPIPENPEVLFFRQRAAIFGHNAADWRSLPDEARATYLGAPDVSKLREEERIEWPNFVIAAPKFPQNGKLQRVAQFKPTPESVEDAARRAAEAVFRAALLDLIVAAVDAVLSVMNAVTGALDVLSGFGGQFADPAILQGDLNNQLKNFSDHTIELLKSFVPATVDLSQYDPDEMLLHLVGKPFADPPVGPSPIDLANDIVEPLIESIQIPNPDFFLVNGSGLELLNFIMDDLKALVNIPLGLLEILGESLGDLGTQITDAVNAVGKAPQMAGEFIGAFLVTQSVLLALKVFKEIPLPLPQTPEFVAYMALTAARLPLAAISLLAIGSLGELTEIIDDLTAAPNQNGQAALQSLINALGSGNSDDQVLDCDLDDIACIALQNFQDLGVVSIAAAGGEAVLLSTTAIFGVTALSLSPAMAVLLPPILALGTINFLIGSQIKDGAVKAERALCSALAQALQDDTQLRRALPELTTDQIDLDAIYPAIAPDSWVLLVLPDGQAAAYPVDRVAETGRSDFNLNSRVSRLTLVDPDFGFKDESSDHPESPFLRQVRDITIFAQSEALPAAEEPDERTVPQLVNGHEEILLDSKIPLADLEPGRLLVMEGTSEGQHIAEPVTLLNAEPDPDSECTRLILSRPALHRYERSSVTIYGNVATATHGATQLETLGSGDASQIGQQFTLKGKPLTYIPAQGTGGSASTLEVRVNRLRWQVAASPINNAPDERVYLVHTEDDGTVSIHFGDGANGSRLPTGQENVSAKYRMGIGTKGNAAKDRITLLTRYPPGVRSVRNPLPATGGTDARSLTDSREVIPTPARAMRRVVSLDDYALYALTFPDVAKALATWTWSGQGRSIFVTVAGQGGNLLAQDRLDALRASLRDAGEPHVRCEVQNYHPAPFQITGRIMVMNNYEVADVCTATTTALHRRFAFDRLQFGQPVTLLQVMSTIQSVPGVLSVDIDVLQRTGQPDRPERHLKAALPRAGDTGATEAAEMLILERVQLC